MELVNVTASKVWTVLHRDESQIPAVPDVKQEFGQPLIEITNQRLPSFVTNQRQGSKNWSSNWSDTTSFQTRWSGTSRSGKIERNTINACHPRNAISRWRISKGPYLEVERVAVGRFAIWALWGHSGMSLAEVVQTFNTKQIFYRCQKLAQVQTGLQSSIS